MCSFLIWHIVIMQGLRQRRLVGADYWEVIERFMSSLQRWQPHTLVQYEDFANHHAFQLLEKYRTSHCCFNDDIQGTACITLAGVRPCASVHQGWPRASMISFYCFYIL